MKSTKDKLNGLKVSFKKEKGQATLQEAFKAGELVKEAKRRKAQAMIENDEILEVILKFKANLYKVFQ